MRKSNTRAVSVGAPLLAAIVFIGCGANEETRPSPTGTESGPQAAQAGVTDVTETGEPELEPAPAQIVVRDGKPVGGVARLKYERGDCIRFTVVSDTADEVHVHGYDLTEEVAAGGRAGFHFQADFEGVFEVELEGAHVQIAELRIEP